MPVLWWCAFWFCGAALGAFPSNQVAPESLIAYLNQDVKDVTGSRIVIPEGEVSDQASTTAAPNTPFEIAPFDMSSCENNCQVNYNLVTELKWQPVPTTTLVAATEYRFRLPDGTLKTTTEYNKGIRRVFGGIQGQMDVGKMGFQ